MAGASASFAAAGLLGKGFAAVEVLRFLFRNSSLLLASRLIAEGVGFFFFSLEAKVPFPMVSTEKVKLVPMVKEKEKVRDLPASVWQKSRHWDTSFASSSCPITGAGIAAIFTAYIWIR